MPPAKNSNVCINTLFQPSSKSTSSSVHKLCNKTIHAKGSQNKLTKPLHTSLENVGHPSAATAVYAGVTAPKTGEGQANVLAPVVSSFMAPCAVQEFTSCGSTPLPTCILILVVGMQTHKPAHHHGTSINLLSKDYHDTQRQSCSVKNLAVSASNELERRRLGQRHVIALLHTQQHHGTPSMH